MSLSAFPRELSLLVFQYLDHGDKIRMSSTCKEYRDLLEPEIFQTIRFSSDTQRALSALAAVEAYGAYTERIEFTCESCLLEEFTAPALPPAASTILSGSLTKNLYTISIKFTFDFDSFGCDKPDPDHNDWHSAFYLFEDEETEDDVHKREATFRWRAIMNETWQALSNNYYARELIIDDLIPKWSSALDTDKFHQFLSRIESATIRTAGEYDCAGWETNGLVGFTDFFSRLDEIFFRHMQNLKHLHIEASDPLGLSGCYHIPLALKPRDLPALESLQLKRCFVGPELVLFVQSHSQGLKTLDIKECVSGGDGHGMAENAIYWAEFFDGIYSAKPMLTSLIAGGGLAPLTSEEYYREHKKEAESEVVQNIRKTINNDPRLKVFGYGYLDDKYGTFYCYPDLNVKEFLDSNDQQAYDRLMGLIYENRAREK